MQAATIACDIVGDARDQDRVSSKQFSQNHEDQCGPGSPKEISLDNCSVVAKLGLREMTRRHRYRAWGIL